MNLIYIPLPIHNKIIRVNLSVEDKDIESINDIENNNELDI